MCHCADIVAVHCPTGGVRPGRPALQFRNAALTAWLRRPLPITLRHTRELAEQARRHPEVRTALWQTLKRLAAALRERRPLSAAVEAAARRLDAQGACA